MKFALDDDDQFRLDSGDRSPSEDLQSIEARQSIGVAPLGRLSADIRGHFERRVRRCGSAKTRRSASTGLCSTNP